MKLTARIKRRLMARRPFIRIFYFQFMSNDCFTMQELMGKYEDMVEQTCGIDFGANVDAAVQVVGRRLFTADILLSLIRFK